MSGGLGAPIAKKKPGRASSRATEIEEIDGFRAEGLWLETLIVPQSQILEGIRSLVTSRPGANPSQR